MKASVALINACSTLPDSGLNKHVIRVDANSEKNRSGGVNVVTEAGQTKACLGHVSIIVSVKRWTARPTALARERSRARRGTSASTVRERTLQRCSQLKLLACN